MRTILSIDGGGIRGIIPALLLAKLEARLGRPTAELFDLIAGTSTGGILALGLTRPGANGKPMYSAAQLVDLYEKQGSAIFHTPAWRKLVPAARIVDEKYPSSGIEGVLEHYFADARLKDAVTSVLVPSYEIERRMPFFFRSSRARFDPAYDWPMKLAARATSAAPTYFAPLRMEAGGTNGYYALIDGAVFANNPAMCALAEARDLWGAQDMMLLSLGTGSLTRPIRYAQAKHWGLAGWAKPMLEIVFDGVSSTVDYQMCQLLDGGFRPHNYFRIQVTLPPELQQMDSVAPENLRGLKLLAEAELRNRHEEFDQVCDLLARSLLVP